jgi:hypothetical protein
MLKLREARNKQEARPPGSAVNLRTAGGLISGTLLNLS